MKVKRQKRVRKLLAFYKSAFHIKPQYNVIVDGTFCKSALKFKVNISDQLPRYLDGETKLLTTKCILAECESFGSLLYGPLKVLRQFSCLDCGHDPAQTAAQCLRKQLKKKKKYLIATQDRDLSEHIRSLPGVPLIFISHNAINLEPPSSASLDAAKTITDEKVSPDQWELKRVAELAKATFGEEKKTARKKKKKKGGPNPLSCKKKKTEVTKKKRKRKKDVGLSGGDSAT